MPPKSNLWQYFEKVQDNNFAVCRFCCKKIKTSGNTTNLKCHLEAMQKHALQLPSASSKSKYHSTTFVPRRESETSREVEIATETETSTSGSGLIFGSTSRFFATSTNASASKSSACVDEDTVSLPEEPLSETEFGSSVCSSSSIKRQKTITESFSELKSYATGGKKHTKITNAILFLICRDYQPINIVENEGFAQLMHTVSPQYKLPSRKFLNKLLDNKYKAITTLFQEKIGNVKNFTLTSDIWTETMRSKSFLGITLHFLDGSEICSTTLGVHELEERHTSKYIAER